jgi:hypothetical protein
MNRSDLHLGEVWQCRLNGAIEGPRQIVAMFARTVAVSSPTDASMESYPWPAIEFLSLLRRPAKLSPTVLP